MESGSFKLRQCNCGLEHTPQTVTWIGDMTAYDDSYTLKLYNCPQCSTTKSIKIVTINNKLTQVLDESDDKIVYKLSRKLKLGDR